MKLKIVYTYNAKSPYFSSEHFMKIKAVHAEAHKKEVFTFS